VFSIKEILNMIVQFLITAIFAALMVFYGLAFWHWRNDGKQRDAKRENSSRPVAHARTLGG
jgi:hypothetical protein